MTDTIYYKVSYVVEGGVHPGAIINTDKEPQEGEQVIFDGRVFQITEVAELMPPLGDFGFIHCTCRFIGMAD